MASITWTVHLANKKACWYQFNELQGNLLLGPQNSYKNLGVKRRNKSTKGTSNRRKLIIDPGPRTISKPSARVEFAGSECSSRIQVRQLSAQAQAWVLGQVTRGVTHDSVGRLIVLGGLGDAGGDQTIENYGGQDTWHDDISDGPVSCVLQLKSGETIELRAWCLVGSPKFAPELVNISTLDDTMYDAAIRHLGAAPDIYGPDGFNNGYVANFDRASVRSSTDQTVIVGSRTCRR